MQLCEWDDWEQTTTALIDAVGRGERAVRPFHFLALASNPALQLQCARRHVRAKFPHQAPDFPAVTEAADGRIRVGYFSADFRQHAMAHLIAEVIERLDRERFEVIGFAFSASDGSPIRQRLEQAFDRFFVVADMADAAVVELARAQGVAIAIDLNGHTAFARSGIFARRAAPVQVAHLGYPGTTGADFIDYLIADATVVPESHHADYSEHIVTLPDTYWFNDSTKVISTRQFTRVELGLPDHAFVFCCFNNSYKLTPDVFDVWMRLLLAVEGSVLWLLDGGESVVENLRYEAEQRGVDPARLIFAPRLDMAEHLSRQRAADLFLDTFHCNAHTTASDALWAGLPLVTCTGASFAGRVAASLLNAINLPELITITPAEYEALALALARDPARLAGLRERLANNLATAPLFDTRAYTRHLEAAYAAMIERQHAGLPPAALTIERLAM